MSESQIERVRRLLDPHTARAERLDSALNEPDKPVHDETVKRLRETANLLVPSVHMPNKARNELRARLELEMDRMDRRAESAGHREHAVDGGGGPSEARVDLDSGGSVHLINVEHLDDDAARRVANRIADEARRTAGTDTRAQ